MKSWADWGLDWLAIEWLNLTEPNKRLETPALIDWEYKETGELCKDGKRVCLELKDDCLDNKKEADNDAKLRYFWERMREREVSMEWVPIEMDDLWILMAK